MAETGIGFHFLRGKHARILSALLLVQAIGFYAISRPEKVPSPRPLRQFPTEIGSWSMAQEGVVEKDTMEVLRADDVMTRTYADAGGQRFANLFVAFFRSQRTGQTPHSPKNCLPGSGWAPSESGIATISVPGLAEPLRVNRYVVAKGGEQSVVFYWYQSRHRVIASEYRAKIALVWDSIRYDRSDTALVRVVVPVSGDRVDVASATGEQFVRAFFLTLRNYLPS
jgi:EpsI family protein